MNFLRKQNGLSTFSILIIIAIIIAAILCLVLLTNRPKQDLNSTQNSKDVLVGFSITTLQEERWEKDKSEFLKRADELGMVVDLETAQNDVKKQVSQLEAMIAKGVDVIVVVPLDANSLTDVLDKAHKAGIKIISYDRMVNNAPIDVYLSFDNEKVGEYQAQYVMDTLKDKIKSGSNLKVAYVGGSDLDNNALTLRKGSFKILQPLIDNKSIEIVYDKYTKDWNPDIAYSGIKDYLKKNNGKIDAVIAANDGTAFGVITALSELGLSGKIPVSGQDAELAAARRIIAGTQTMTVYKPILKLASSAAETAFALANGKIVKTNSMVNNGRVDVPSILLIPTAVTKSNIDDTLIKDGYHTREDIYKK